MYEQAKDTIAIAFRKQLEDEQRACTERDSEIEDKLRSLRDKDL
jgi:hypothetical protein